MQSFATTTQCSVSSQLSLVKIKGGSRRGQVNWRAHTMGGDRQATIGNTRQAPSQAARTPTQLADRLRAIGQRATPQRLLILSAFRQPHEHLTADEVYARVGPLAPA